MAKHDPLASFLAKQSGDSCALTHEEIEGIIGARLPPSASEHGQWWGNEGGGGRPQCRSCLESGWKVDDGCKPHDGVVRFVPRK